MEELEEYIDPAEGLGVGDTYENDQGMWEIGEGGSRMLIEPSEDWIIKHRQPETIPEPTLEEKLEILEQENSMLKIAQAETNTTLLEFMEEILMGGM
ncbi:hypothetical protein KHA94_13425 [Bacillus sp. FJAT-49705]|uniref:Uncharacterized protein n=1 Tax=Cytobacillus citreus TaxID=2833586 RepID=A0ABS5NTN3_9BACI|nr:hypothetical protein [Cytobacillus citreus]MBS4191184.1 hypothetical protein [Cytobacillus citreus]